MARLEFENLEFREINGRIEATLLKNYLFYMDKKDIDSIGRFSVGKNHIEFKGITEKQASKRFNFLISEGIKNLRNKLNNKPAVYVHKNSGIPLIGNLFFGIVDRGTTIIEVKPLTSCNLNCIFCSVDEGLSSKKHTDFVVEEEYLVEEMKKLLEYKKNNNIEVFINPHGEPLLYADIVKLVRDIRKIKYIKNIAIATNAASLTKDLVDQLEKAGLDQFNFSVNSLDEKKSRMIAGTKDYDIKNIKEIMEYIVSKTKLKLILAPVWIPGINDKDVEEIIEYCKKTGCEIGIQKYIRHKKGRNPKNVGEMEWPEFFKELERFQEKKEKNLVIKGPEKTKELPKPFKTGDTVKARLVCNGRYKDEKIGVAKQRTITIYGCEKDVGNEVKAKIIKSKSNTFFGKCSG